MECDKFERLGLMYVAGELSGPDAAEYEAHLAECGYCKREVELYREESASLYTEEMLGEVPSAAVDKEILRVCTNPKKQFSMGMMSVFLRKYVPVSVFLMLVMVAVGAFLMHHVKRADSLQDKYTASDDSSKTNGEEAIPSIDYGELAKAADSGAVKDSGAVRPFDSQDVDGVVPVSDSGIDR